jgi:hypothetical protein
LQHCSQQEFFSLTLRIASMGKLSSFAGKVLII